MRLLSILNQNTICQHGYYTYEAIIAYFIFFPTHHTWTKEWVSRIRGL